MNFRFRAARPGSPAGMKPRSVRRSCRHPCAPCSGFETDRVGARPPKQRNVRFAAKDFLPSSRIRSPARFPFRNRSEGPNQAPSASAAPHPSDCAAEPSDRSPSERRASANAVFGAKQRVAIARFPTVAFPASAEPELPFGSAPGLSKRFFFGKEEGEFSRIADLRTGSQPAPGRTAAFRKVFSRFAAVRTLFGSALHLPSRSGCRPGRSAPNGPKQAPPAANVRTARSSARNGADRDRSSGAAEHPHAHLRSFTKSPLYRKTQNCGNPMREISRRSADRPVRKIPATRRIARRRNPIVRSRPPPRRTAKRNGAPAAYAKSPVRSGRQIQNATVGAVCAPSAAVKRAFRSNPNIPATRLAGKRRIATL